MPAGRNTKYLKFPFRIIMFFKVLYLYFKMSGCLRASLKVAVTWWRAVKRVVV